MCAGRVAGFPAQPAVDHESPDFLVTTAGRTIGIEMQEFIQGASREGASAREGESLRALVMTMAEREFEARQPDLFLYVYGHWNRSVALDRRTVPDLARRVSSLVETLVPPPPGPGQGVSRRDASYDELEAAGVADSLLRLDVHLFPPATFGLWASPEGGYASTDLVDLRAQVQAKEAKVATYRESCSEVWLVLYALALPSGGFDMEVLPGERVQTQFDHVVFLDAVSGNYVLLAG